jgi:putative flippase GtrA
MNITRQRTFIELLTIGRFAIVGVLATIVHIGIVWALIVYAELHTFVANFVAFLMAFTVSFSGHYYWTFYSKNNRWRAIKRFFFIAASAFMVNNIVLAGLLSVEQITPVFAAICAVFVIPVFTYVLSRLWVFRK